MVHTNHDGYLIKTSEIFFQTASSLFGFGIFVAFLRDNVPWGIVRKLSVRQLFIQTAHVCFGIVQILIVTGQVQNGLGFNLILIKKLILATL